MEIIIYENFVEITVFNDYATYECKLCKQLTRLHDEYCMTGARYYQGHA